MQKKKNKSLIVIFYLKMVQNVNNVILVLKFLKINALKVFLIVLDMKINSKHPVKFVKMDIVFKN